MNNKLRYVALSLAVFCLSAVGAAHASDRHVKVINDTSYTLERLYGSNIDRTIWEEDILGRSVLMPGYNVNVDFDDGSGQCLFDLKAVFSNGATIIRRNVDVCTVERWTITDDNE